MSHIVMIETRVHDAEALRSACRRLELEEPVEGEAELFGGAVRGWLVRLPEWRYPVCCDLLTGRLRYDNYDGKWGDEAHLHRFVQMYAVEKAKLEARRRGHAVSERPLEDGAIRLTVQVAA